MATLENVSGASLVPDTTGLNNLLLQTFGTKQHRDQTANNKELMNQQVNTLTTSNNSKEREAALLRISQIDPKVADSMRGIIETGNTQALESARTEAEDGYKKAIFIQKLPDYQSKRNALIQMAQEDAAQGKPVDRYVDLINMPEEKLDNELLKMQVLGTDLKTLTATPEIKEIKTENAQGVDLTQTVTIDPVTGQRTEIATQTKDVEPKSSIAQARQDLNNGLITPSEFSSITTKATTGDEGKASAVTKVFQNGAAIQALPNGQVQVRDPSGNVVTGDARLEALKAAREADLEFEKTKSGAQKAGAVAISQSEKAFESLAGIKTSISNMDQAIDLLDQGAETGPIISKLPSVRASSVALDNVQKAMGLDVIGTTTFGALSKGELDLALSKALPTGLKPAALREWLVEKKAAQEKLANYLEDAAIYLGTPGNTVAGWVEAQQSLKPEGKIDPSHKETGQKTPEGYPIYERPDGSTYAVKM